MTSNKLSTQYVKNDTNMWLGIVCDVSILSIGSYKPGCFKILDLHRTLK